MLRGSYSVYLLSDIADLGWRGNPRRRFIALLWYKHGGKTFVQTVPIIVPSARKDRPGHDRDSNCQFQMIFRLFNGDKPVIPPEGKQLDYDRLIRIFQKACRDNALNFCITFKIKTGDDGKKRQFVHEIAMSDSVVVPHSPKIKWPASWEEKFHKYATPNGKPLNLDLNSISSDVSSDKACAKPVTVVCDMEVNVELEDALENS